MSLDFKEIPSEEHYTFQRMVSALMAAGGFEVDPRGTGPDGGVDIRAVLRSSISGDTFETKFLVQCKHKIHGGQNFRRSDFDEDFRSLINAHEFDVYVIVISNDYTDDCVSMFDSLSVKHGKKILRWDRNTLTEYLHKHLDIFKSYLPNQHADIYGSMAESAPAYEDRNVNINFSHLADSQATFELPQQRFDQWWSYHKIHCKGTVVVSDVSEVKELGGRLKAVKLICGENCESFRLRMPSSTRGFAKENIHLFFKFKGLFTIFFFIKYGDGKFRYLAFTNDPREEEGKRVSGNVEYVYASTLGGVKEDRLENLWADLGRACKQAFGFSYLALRDICIATNKEFTFLNLSFIDELPTLKTETVD